jgi:hypothetical protein
MGSFSERLSKRLRGLEESAKPKPVDPAAERLVSVAIMRGGQLHKGFKAHWELRASIDPTNREPTAHVPGDVEGFYTSKDRFVTRREAQFVAVAAGQLSGLMGRDLLSSDLDW